MTARWCASWGPGAVSERAMRYTVLIAGAVLLCSCTWEWPIARQRRSIAKVIYEASSGTVPQEHQWTEQYVISRDSIVFSRSGPREATELNSGTWEFVIDSEEIASLFDALEESDIRRIAEVTPPDPVDGGVSELYQLEYRDGEPIVLSYTEGVTYENGELVTSPVQDFVAGLAWPPGAANRYR